MPRKQLTEAAIQEHYMQCEKEVLTTLDLDDLENVLTQTDKVKYEPTRSELLEQFQKAAQHAGTEAGVGHALAFAHLFQRLTLLYLSDRVDDLQDTWVDGMNQQGETLGPLRGQDSIGE